MFRPGDTKKDKSKNEQHLHRNLVFSASTVVFAVLVLIFYVISNLPAVSSFFGKVLSVLSPVIGGAALAYLCNPILSFWERHLLRRIRSHDLKRMLSIFLTYLIVILVIAAIGVALGNAAQCAKEVADFIAPRYDEDGAAIAIEKFLLG